MVGTKENNVPLCLGCYEKMVQTKTATSNMLAGMINYSADQADYAIGLPPSGPRLPIRSPVNVGAVTLNNIKVDNSAVGVINTGNIQSVDACVTALDNTGDPDLANALKEFKNAVLADTEIESASRNELMEILSVIASEAAERNNGQHKSVVKTLLQRLEGLLEVGCQIAEAWEKWGPTIKSAFL